MVIVASSGRGTDAIDIESAARQILQALSGDCPPHILNREIWPAAAPRARLPR
jgi:hypothetical protein